MCVRSRSKYKVSGVGRAKLQRGLSLIESLVALLVLALGIMGLAGVQTRMLAETRTTNSRAIAVGLIDDLINRMLLNRDRVVLNNGYNLAWGLPAAGPDCSAGLCSDIQLAQSDLFVWRTALARLLPGGDARVYQLPIADGTQFGIMIAWPANEGKVADVDSATYSAQFAVNSGDGTVACPTGSICHVVFVRP